MRRRRLIFLIPIGIAAISLFAFIGGSVVRLLWNALLPPLFGLPVVTFWQALGLLALCRILFGGMWKNGMWQGGPRHTSGMTPEERERFRQRLRERFWGSDGAAGTSSRPSTS